MSTSDILCYHCGTSLAALSLPFSRRDSCPQCSVHLHACRQCASYDPNVIGQCREDDAEEVLEKARVNFCEWFVPSSNAYDGVGRTADAAAAAELAALFGDDTAEPPAATPQADAENLFK